MYQKCLKNILKIYSVSENLFSVIDKQECFFSNGILYLTNELQKWDLCSHLYYHQKKKNLLPFLVKIFQLPLMKAKHIYIYIYIYIYIHIDLIF